MRRPWRSEQQEVRMRREGVGGGGPAGAGRWGAGLEQAAVRVRVLELQRLDAAVVVEKARELRVGRRLGEGGLREQRRGGEHRNR